MTLSISVRRGALLGLLAALLSLALLAGARPALAGEDTSITGFDKYDLGSGVPAEGDEFYTLFAGPASEQFGAVPLVEYTASYSLEMPSGTYAADVTVGFGDARTVDAIVVSYTVEGQTITQEQADALALDIRKVLLDTYAPDLVVLDSFPGGADRAAEAEAGSAFLMLGDDQQRSIWLSQDGTDVVVLYATQPVGEEMYNNVFGETPAEDGGVAATAAGGQ